MHKKENRQKINKSDKYRVLVTETLPYETPLIFSNDGFYKIAKNSDTLDVVTRFIFERLARGVGRKKYTVPYKYKVRKSAVDYRQLALLHPISQMEMKYFYENYDKLICHFCSRSDFSVRAPQAIASTFFYKNSWENINKYKKAGVSEAGSDKLTKHSSSYYTYKGYDRLYKFFGSTDFLRLEKEFEILLTLDVSKCFDSIYTHSIAWATKEKQYVKANLAISSTFGQVFDSLMQQSNHSETNGIVIGPEISRIFAEIIFQDVDCKVKERLAENDIGFVKGGHYDIRRYVDDVFIFARDGIAAKRIYSLYGEQLAHYNLHTNAAKSITYHRPFFTSKSRVIREVNHHVNDFIKKFLYSENENSVLKPTEVFRKDRLVRSFVDAIKAICLENAVGYDDVSSYLISAFFERTKRLVNIDEKDVNENGLDNYRDAVQVLLELMLFFYSVSSSVSASYKLCASLIILSRFAEKRLQVFEHTIKQKIFELSVDLLSEGRAKSNADVRNFLFLEVLNVVLAISDLGEDYILEEKTVRDLLTGKPGYFQLTACLYYIKDRKQFFDVKKDILAEIELRFKSLAEVQVDTEQACLLLDMLVCPYVDKSRRKKWLKRLYTSAGQVVPDSSDLDLFLVNEKQNYWFINWYEVDLLNALERKELRQVY
jgi:hypothetical protein